MVMTNKTQREIARELNLAEQTVSNYKNRPDFKSLEEQYQAEKLDIERKKLGQLVGKALKAYDELLNSENDNIRYAVAKDVFDRTGHKPIDKQETTLSGDLDIGQRADLVEKYLGGDEG